MAIVNTFAKCLDSPYLAHDPEAPRRVPDLLELAVDRLEAAQALIASAQAADQTDAGLIAYEAMFACIRALVYSKGYRESGLRCLLLACEELFVRPGALDPALLLKFQRAQGMKTPPGENVAAAEALVHRAFDLLTSTPAPAGGGPAPIRA